MSRTSMKGFVYRQYTSDGLFVADYKSSREASEKVGTSANSVVRAAHGERKTGGGFIWKKVPEDNLHLGCLIFPNVWFFRSGGQGFRF